jgi:type I restriction enzyme S subunit
MGLTKYRLGDLIEQRREKNQNYDCPIKGVSREGFIDPKQKDADTDLYNVFYKYDFVFNPARMEINSIALNIEYEKAICSSLYEIFYVKDITVLLPEYLNLFIKRDEFARNCEFIGWGSAREYCRVGDISEIIIELPPLPIQQKYVDINNAMLANQRVYETGLEDIKLTCDAYIDRLRLKLPHEAIGQYIELSDKRNDDLDYGVNDVRGVSIEKRFIDTKADMNGVSLKPYYLVAPDEFAYVTVTSRNGEKISLAHNGSERTYICSSSYVVFRVVNIKKLLPRYLRIFFSRSEFDRYSRFHSWGSARETFDWSEMCDVKIPIPDIKEQESIVEIYNAYLMRRDINEKLKAQIKDLCPILIKGSLEEANT